MAFHSPDTYVLFQPVDSNLPQRPGWPAVICRLNNNIPAKIRAKRPLTHSILVLLIGKFEYRWANARDLGEFNIFCSDEAARERPGLRKAYKLVTDAIASDLPPRYWSAQFTDDFATEDSENLRSKSKPERSREESDYEFEIERAMEESLKAIGRKKRPSPVQSGFQLLTPPKKPRPNRPPSPTNGYCVNATASFANENPSFSTPTQAESSRQARNSSELSRSYTARYDVTENEASNLVHSAPSNQPVPRNGKGKTSPVTTTSQDSIAGGSNAPVNTPASSFTTDVTEENLNGLDADLLDNADWVTFLVGPERTKFIIPFEAVQNRPCFFGANSKLNLVKKGNGHYFERQSLLRMDPRNFESIAEYLQSGDFGQKVIEHEDDKLELIDGCLETWNVARELGMLDLMEYIEQKMRKSLPWPLDAALSVAERVHRCEDSVDPTEDLLKIMMAEFIAENFLKYLDETHLRRLRKKFTEFPELEENVHTARSEMLKRQRGVLELEKGKGEKELIPDDT
ncbi:hypothetical protein BCR34DRAFT_560597 [Clohesyomyces aquaticus]|uniref:Uncharacterized protein n=1 Tax=Clohesyomyces aquaticus TaxID=1231657 RepID=A0A1Y1ZVM7_9PLEO|nr:hypothetical protein BCR34DRAFT_560597 [Clohesyomyces aquaticus]